MLKQKRGEDPLGNLIGDHLGLLVDEIPVGKEITSAVCAAPKSYSLEIEDATTHNTTHVIKQKGVTMHCENTKRINHENMETMVCIFCRKNLQFIISDERIH